MLADYCVGHGGDISIGCRDIRVPLEEMEGTVLKRGYCSSAPVARTYVLGNVDRTLSCDATCLLPSSCPSYIFAPRLGLL